ncbi:MAG: OB-fold nucleic acid binding domain-containing protein [Candidatus Diapherotrites archaeon]
MKVNELKAKAAIDSIEGEIVSIGEVRSFANERGSGKVANAALKDDTGEVKMTLWNEQTEQVKEGDKIKIEEGWCSEYQGQIQIGTGKNGKLTVLE